MKNIWLKTISVVVALTFFLSMLPIDARAVEDPEGVPLPFAEGGKDEVAVFNPETFALPAQMGTVKDSWKGKTDKAVIHIQDAHCNYDAQKQISNIIEYLSGVYGVDTVNLEGGTGEYDLAVFTNILNKHVRQEVVDSFVHDGLVNGAEYFAATNPDKVKLWGIEKVDLYLQDLDVYRESLTYKEQVDRYIKSLTHILNNLKMHIFSKDLLEMDMKYTQYKTGGLSFKDYLVFLLDKAKQMGIDIKGFANIFLLKQSLEQEGQIDFKLASRQREDLVKKLEASLSRKLIRELAEKMVAFHEKEISQYNFYEYLIEKAKMVNISMKEYPELQKYVVYISLYHAVNKSKIVAELNSLEDSIKGDLFTNDDQRELDVLSKNLVLTKNMFNITMTKEDYEYYMKNRSSFDVRNYLSFIEKQAPRFKMTARPEQDIERLDGYREDIQKFFEISFKRDDAFMENMKFSKQEGKGRLQIAIVMTGGFHTENLCELFRKKGISYVSIIPTFTNPKGYESPYFNLLGGKEAGLVEQFNEIFASASALQVASMLNKALGSQVWEERNIRAFDAAAIVREAVARGIEVTDITTEAGNIIFRMADGTTETMAITKFWKIVGDVDIDAQMDALPENAFSDVIMERGQVQEIKNFLKEIGVPADAVDAYMDELFTGVNPDTELNYLRFVEGVDFGGHPGGFGIRLNRKYGDAQGRLTREGMAKLVHEIVGGLYGNHLMAGKAESWFKQSARERRGKQLAEAPANSPLGKYGRPVWRLNFGERNSVERDFATREEGEEEAAAAAEAAPGEEAERVEVAEVGMEFFTEAPEVGAVNEITAKIQTGDAASVMDQIDEVVLEINNRANLADTDAARGILYALLKSVFQNGAALQGLTFEGRSVREQALAAAANALYTIEENLGHVPEGVPVGGYLRAVMLDRLMNAAFKGQQAGPGYTKNIRSALRGAIEGILNGNMALPVEAEDVAPVRVWTWDAERKMPVPAPGIGVVRLPDGAKIDKKLYDLERARNAAKDAQDQGDGRSAIMAFNAANKLRAEAVEMLENVSPEARERLGLPSPDELAEEAREDPIAQLEAAEIGEGELAAAEGTRLIENMFTFVDRTGRARPMSAAEAERTIGDLDTMIAFIIMGNSAGVDLTAAVNNNLEMMDRYVAEFVNSMAHPSRRQARWAGLRYTARESFAKPDLNTLRAMKMMRQLLRQKLEQLKAQEVQRDNVAYNIFVAGTSQGIYQARELLGYLAAQDEPADVTIQAIRHMNQRVGLLRTNIEALSKLQERVTRNLGDEGRSREMAAQLGELEKMLDELQKSLSIFVINHETQLSSAMKDEDAKERLSELIRGPEDDKTKGLLGQPVARHQEIIDQITDAAAESRSGAAILDPNLAQVKDNEFTAADAEGGVFSRMRDTIIRERHNGLEPRGPVMRAELLMELRNAILGVNLLMQQAMGIREDVPFSDEEKALMTLARRYGERLATSIHSQGIRPADTGWTGLPTRDPAFLRMARLMLQRKIGDLMLEDANELMDFAEERLRGTERGELAPPTRSQMAGMVRELYRADSELDRFMELGVVGEAGRNAFTDRFVAFWRRAEAIDPRYGSDNLETLLEWAEKAGMIDRIGFPARVGATADRLLDETVEALRERIDARRDFETALARAKREVPSMRSDEGQRSYLISMTSRALNEELSKPEDQRDNEKINRLQADLARYETERNELRARRRALMTEAILALTGRNIEAGTIHDSWLDIDPARLEAEIRFLRDTAGTDIYAHNYTIFQRRFQTIMDKKELIRTLNGLLPEAARPIPMGAAELIASARALVRRAIAAVVDSGGTARQVLALLDADTANANTAVSGLSAAELSGMLDELEERGDVVYEDKNLEAGGIKDRLELIGLLNTQLPRGRKSATNIDNLAMDKRELIKAAVNGAESASNIFSILQVSRDEDIPLTVLTDINVQIVGLGLDANGLREILDDIEALGYDIYGGRIEGAELFGRDMFALRDQVRALQDSLRGVAWDQAAGQIGQELAKPENIFSRRLAESMIPAMRGMDRMLVRDDTLPSIISRLERMPLFRWQQASRARPARKTPEQVRGIIKVLESYRDIFMGRSGMVSERLQRAWDGSNEAAYREAMIRIVEASGELGEPLLKNGIYDLTVIDQAIKTAQTQLRLSEAIASRAGEEERAAMGETVINMNQFAEQIEEAMGTLMQPNLPGKMSAGVPVGTPEDEVNWRNAVRAKSKINSFCKTTFGKGVDTPAQADGNQIGLFRIVRGDPMETLTGEHGMAQDWHKRARAGEPFVAYVPEMEGLPTNIDKFQISNYRDFVLAVIQIRANAGQKMYQDLLDLINAGDIVLIRDSYSDCTAGPTVAPPELFRRFLGMRKIVHIEGTEEGSSAMASALADFKKFLIQASPDREAARRTLEGMNNLTDILRNYVMQWSVVERIGQEIEAYIEVVISV